MSKCIRYYENESKTEQLALSDNGKWYSRIYANGTYGLAWTKWREMGELDDITHDNGIIIFIFGYNTIKLPYISGHNSKAPTRFRLP